MTAVLEPPSVEIPDSPPQVFGSHTRFVDGELAPDDEPGGSCSEIPTSCISCRSLA